MKIIIYKNQKVWEIKNIKGDDLRRWNQKKKKQNMKAKYEILDSMECTIATADSFNDALYAAEKYAPAMIFNTEKDKVVYVTE